MPIASDPIASAHYEELIKRFEEHGSFERGGQTFTHITGEQSITRMNEVYGPEGWDFLIKAQGSTAVEAWVVGEVRINERNLAGAPPCTKQQYGTQELKRGSYDATDVFKSAATDALKKCVSLLGIGLYLFNAEARSEIQQGMRESGQTAQPAASRGSYGGGGGGGYAPNNPGAVRTAVGNGPPLACQFCGDPIEGIQFKDGKYQSPETIAQWGLRKYEMRLCMAHYRAANSGDQAVLAMAGSLPVPKNDDENGSLPF